MALLSPSILVRLPSLLKAPRPLLKGGIKPSGSATCQQCDVMGDTLTSLCLFPPRSNENSSTHLTVLTRHGACEAAGEPGAWTVLCTREPCLPRPLLRQPQHLGLPGPPGRLRPAFTPLHGIANIFPHPRHRPAPGTASGTGYGWFLPLFQGSMVCGSQCLYRRFREGSRTGHQGAPLLLHGNFSLSLPPPPPAPIFVACFFHLEILFL